MILVVVVNVPGVDAMDSDLLDAVGVGYEARDRRRGMTGARERTERRLLPVARSSDAPAGLLFEVQ